MNHIIYALCAGTSVLCAYMLLRGYRRTKVRLLLWTGLCFLGFALNNVFLVIDLTILPEYDLRMLRSIPALAGVGFLVYGFIWEIER